MTRETKEQKNKRTVGRFRDLSAAQFFGSSVRAQPGTSRYLAQRAGFTLMEVLLYVALSSIVIGGGTAIALRVLEDRAKHESVLEVQQLGELVVSRMQQNIRAADDVITASSTFGTHPGVLTLDFPGAGTDVIFDTYTTSVSFGGRMTTIRKLQMTDGGAAAVDLTSDLVDVTNFVLNDRTPGSETDNVQIELTIARVNLDNVPTYSAEQSFQTSVSIRKR